jgi:hypothetical protein
VLIIRIDTCELKRTNSYVINKSYEFVVTTWYPLGGMIKIMTNMPPRDSANMRPLLDGMNKIEAFCRDVVAIVREASEMTRVPTRVCPHEFSCILRSITVSGSSQASVGANRSTLYFLFLEIKIHFLGNENSFPRIVGNENSFPTYSIVTNPKLKTANSGRIGLENM